MRQSTHSFVRRILALSLCGLTLTTIPGQAHAGGFDIGRSLSNFGSSAGSRISNGFKNASNTATTKFKNATGSLPKSPPPVIAKSVANIQRLGSQKSATLPPTAGKVGAMIEHQSGSPTAHSPKIAGWRTTGQRDPHNLKPYVQHAKVAGGELSRDAKRAGGIAATTGKASSRALSAARTAVPEVA